MNRDSELKMKKKPEEARRGPMIVMIAGTLAVAALVAWALTRTVEPAPLPPASTVESAAPASDFTPPPSASGTMPLVRGTPVFQPNQATTSFPPQFTPPPGDETSGVRRMGPEELKALVDSKSVTVIDVRDTISYNQGHIPGALHIPMARVEGEAAALPKGKAVVAYCT